MNNSNPISIRNINFEETKPLAAMVKREGSTFCYNILDSIKETDALSKVERIGLRYINLFKENIFDKIKLEIIINDKKLMDESTNLRTEITDDKLIKVLQVGNAVSIARNNKTINGSVIDIDCLHNILDEDFFTSYKGIIEKAHLKEKELFFSLLNESFLNELQPTY